MKDTIATVTPYSKLNHCCEHWALSSFITYLFGIRVSYTIQCKHCKRKITAKTREEAIIKWNKRR